MKKIIHTVSNDLTYDQRMIRICTSLSKAGYEVLLIGRKRSFSKPLVAQPFQQKRIRCWFNSGKFFYLEYNIRLFFFLLFTRFDVINSIDLDTILPGFWLAKWKGKTCVYDAHEYFTEVPEVVERPRIQAIWNWVAFHTIPKLSHCYTVCESLSEVFLEKYGTSFSVIRNVPFYQKNTPMEAPSHSPKILLYQGALNDGRGIEESIRAMKWVENAELWLAGEGDLSAALRALVEDLNLQEKVKFLGYVLPEELKEITQKATIGLNLLQNKGLNYYYSLANKAFDYIQAAKPSINMNFPEYIRLNEQYGTFLLIDHLEEKELANSINKLLTNNELYQIIQANCWKAKEVLIWEKEEEKLLQFYQSICPS